MNLDDMLREPSVIDHSWWTSEGGLARVGEPSVDDIVERSKKQHNIAPALEIEWGGGGPTIDVDAPAGKVQRNLPDEYLGDAGDVIVFARDRMNRGRMGRGLRADLAANFDEKTLKLAKDGLKKLFALEGVAGCFAVDSTGYPSCAKAMEAASKSPYKRFIRYVVGCSCGGAHMLPSGRNVEASLPESTGNAVDDFLASEQPHKPALVAHCPATMLPILAEDLDPSEMDQSMIDLMSLTGLPQSTTEKLWAAKKAGEYASNAEMLRAAFLSLEDLVAPQKPMLPMQSPSEFALSRADNELDIAPPPEADVDFGDKMNEELGDIEMGGAMEIPDMEMPEPSEEADVELGGPQRDIDVGMEPLLEDEFEGVDIIELEERTVAKELKVDRQGEMTV